MALSLSKQKYTRACQSIVGGVNSPVRAFKAVGAEPLVIKKAKGAHLYDVDGNKYIDYLMSLGARILGHTHPDITEAIKKAVGKDTVTDYVTARKSDTSKYAAFFRHMLKSGVLLPPSQFEAAFLSIAHADQDIQKTIEAVKAFAK